jgi:hypothetical protein
MLDLLYTSFKWCNTDRKKINTILILKMRFFIFLMTGVFFQFFRNNFKIRNDAKI